MGQRMRIALGAIVIIVATAAAVAVAILARDRQSPFGEAVPQGDTEPAFSVAGMATDAGIQPVTVELEWSETSLIGVGVVEGRITHLPDPQIFGRSDLVVEVDNIPRFGLVADRPLWRELRWGDSGGDVVAVAELLRDMGYLADTFRIDEDLQVGTGINRSVRQFEADHGWDQTGVFDPSYVIWLGAVPFGAEHAMVSAGEVLQGEEVLWVSEASLARARITSADGQDVSVDADDWQLTLISSTRSVRLGAGLSVDQAALQSLGGEFQPEDKGVVRSIQGTLSRIEPRAVLTVPASAVVVSANGATCVLTETVPLAVEVLGSRSGSALLDATFDSATPILVNPDQDASCT